MSLENNTTINCTFLSGFTGSAHCTVRYGTDPTYMNLPYSAVSMKSGTAGDSVSVVLRKQLNSSTVYYYTVSAVSGDVIVRVLGKFTTPKYSMYTHCALIVDSTVRTAHNTANVCINIIFLNFFIYLFIFIYLYFIWEGGGGTAYKS